MAMDVNLTLGAYSTVASFAVFEWNSLYGLIGMDWLKQNKAILDIPNDCMIIGGESIPFVDIV
jgi:hypothetical protein